MTGRAKTSGKTSKARGRKFAKSKGRPAPTKAAPVRHSVTIDSHRQPDQRTPKLAEALKQLSEAREQQAATSDVLKVISSVPGDLTRVFETMLEKAIGICQAKFGIAFQWEGTAF